MQCKMIKLKNMFVHYSRHKVYTFITVSSLDFNLKYHYICVFLLFLFSEIMYNFIKVNVVMVSLFSFEIKVHGNSVVFDRSKPSAKF